MVLKTLSSSSVKANDILFFAIMKSNISACRGLIDNPGYWRYSSARNYNGKTGLIDVYVDL